MGKRTDQTVITALALLYVNESYGEGMILYDKTIEFDRVINENLEKMNSSCGVLYREEIENNFFFTATAEKGKFYAIIRPDADIMKAWAFYGGMLPSDVFIASRMPNALETIGIKNVNKHECHIEGKGSAIKAAS